MGKRTANGTTNDLIKICARQEWDCLLRMNVPTAELYGNLQSAFGKWITEAEQEDGTPSFGWVWFVPRRHDGPNTACYTLVRGLASGDVHKWTKRWTAITGNSDSRCGKLHAHKVKGNVLTRLLHHALKPKDFADCYIDVRFRTWPESVG
jgi:hypothetical protein